jgi:hypothetical protein
VSEAVSLLDQSHGADIETRLMMLINGWGRGLAAGLEELALGIEDLRAAGASTLPAERETGLPAPEPRAAADAKERDGQTRAEGDEDRLRARAAESRRQTAALRDEASELRADEAAADD